MEDLTKKKCIPCEVGSIEPMERSMAESYMSMTPLWVLNEKADAISKDYKFKDFVEAMAFVNKVADVAESEGHHPDIQISYNKVHIDLTTHAIKGLSENDFIVASKIDKI
ncbi:MAG: 4a-hydroxytetrahydrobiopterin dehydratase [Candidatus Pacebacteria bacterium]|nr:4a-hydroxytetrahydrobiopterin dehydratase [Candidatus Paceibacterota bacterium]MBP9839462.1 4a-hydroxytetrahydrobiopterin dehydratase [Candidatus Paceibacterota bacterium]